MACNGCGGEWKAILFDLDDTLYNQREWLSGAFLLAGQCLEDELGVPALRAQAKLLDLSAKYGSSSGNLFNRLLASYDIAEDPVLIEALVRRFYEYCPPKLPTYPGVFKTLRGIRSAGLVCGVITNGRSEVQRSKINALGIAEFFTVVLVSGDFGDAWKKPSSRMYREALVELGMEGSECVYVGDNPGIDFVPAREAGYYTVRVRKGEYASLVVDLQTDADCTIDEISLLTSALDIPGRQGLSRVCR